MCGISLRLSELEWMMGGKVEEKGRGAYVSSPSPELVEGELERGYNSGE